MLARPLLGLITAATFLAADLAAAAPAVEGGPEVEPAPSETVTVTTESGETYETTETYVEPAEPAPEKAAGPLRFTLKSLSPRLV